MAILTVRTIERLQNSASGNPRWRLTDAQGLVFETEPDAQVGYAIDPEWLLPTRVWVRLNEHGRIVMAVPIVHTEAS